MLQSCSICPLYHFLCPGNCANCISPGMCRTVFHKREELFNVGCDHRRVVTPPDPCVSFSAVELSCPPGNTRFGHQAQKDHGEYPKLKCRVCGVNHLPPDESSVAGVWAGRISWGPNQFEGVISETEIRAYRVYVTDSWYQKLGTPVLEKEGKIW